MDVAFQLSLLDDIDSREVAGLLPISRYLEEDAPTLHKVVIGTIQANLAGLVRDPNNRDDINSMSLAGLSPLHIVVIKGDMEALRILLNAGANLLLQHGADINLLTNTGWSILLHAAGYSEPAAIRHLVVHVGMDSECADGEGDTPLFNAICHYRHENVIELISLGANVRHVNKNRDTMLHYLAWFPDIELIR
ncbi:ankyrin repeat-containing domain protein [Lasiosphaeria miniovina]|uniref:Ankyrin repeat-containing domain protein n=1 Tax=Lasiosphaeria miniovina TaxID=1954250 RepID=A0AA40AX35_9PEZI|nr:ankyrin repeat-containing domain protein [Lasiosphaeria miniovina]KAK0723611.1 ankyrin repeat-containing domain protein [Lasiosphaeria miniovina]